MVMVILTYPYTYIPLYCILLYTSTLIYLHLHTYLYVYPKLHIIHLYNFYNLHNQAHLLPCVVLLVMARYAFRCRTASVRFCKSGGFSLLQALCTDTHFPEVRVCGGGLWWDVVWCGVLCCGVVCCGVVWCGVL
jgi:hypothetical protein